MSPTPSKSILWVTDAWDTLDHKQDSTLRLAQETILQGQRSFWCNSKDISVRNSKVIIEAKQLIEILPERNCGDIKRGASSLYSPSDFYTIHYRADPPVDLSYIHPLQILWSFTRSSKQTEVVNPISALLLMGEKIEPLNIPGLSPPCVVSSNWDILLNFGKKIKRTVLKPLNSAQSKGVEKIDWSSPSELDRAKILIESATDHFKIPVLLQRFQPEIVDGEYRFWFLDGKFLASIQKLPIPGDFRVNHDRGSQVRFKAPGAREKKAINVIGRHLSELKIRLAAVDMIGGFVTDFNFTSPGLLTVMEDVLHTNLAKSIVQKLKKRWQ